MKVGARVKPSHGTKNEPRKKLEKDHGSAGESEIHRCQEGESGNGSVGGWEGTHTHVA